MSTINNPKIQYLRQKLKHMNQSKQNKLNRPKPPINHTRQTKQQQSKSTNHYQSLNNDNDYDDNDDYEYSGHSGNCRNRCCNNNNCNYGCYQNTCNLPLSNVFYDDLGYPIIQTVPYASCNQIPYPFFNVYGGIPPPLPPIPYPSLSYPQPIPYPPLLPQYCDSGPNSQCSNWVRMF